MKEVVTVNIGKTVFVLEDDACRMLQRYIADIGRHCDKNVREDTLEEVEVRIAEILSQKQTVHYRAITTEMVKNVIDIIGPAESFGEYTDEEAQHRRKLIQKLTRSRDDRIIGGVCGGISKFFGIDTVLTRLLAFVLIFFGGVSIWIYLILWIVLPNE